MSTKIALLMGDRNGIGPEIVAKVLAAMEAGEGAAIVVVGDPEVLAEGQRTAGVTLEMRRVSAPGEIGGGGGDDRPVLLEFTPEPAIETTPGEAATNSGREMIATLKHAVGLTRDEVIGGFAYAPLNKQALHDAGMGFEDEFGFIADSLEFDGVRGELNVIDGLWTSRVTSHVALAEVAGLITEERVLDVVRLIDGALKAAGNPAPRIAVAGLNPHAGDGGNFGREEIDSIAPAVARAQEEKIDAAGPFSPDTVFVRARGGAFDGVVTMYHDQSQIAMKLMGFESGVTLFGGLPVPITTCAHGTGYDIVGRGEANPQGLRHALTLCRRMAQGLGAAS